MRRRTAAKIKVGTFASSPSSRFEPGSLASEAPPLTLFLTLEAAHVGWAERQCRVVPQRVNSLLQDSDGDEGVPCGMGSSRRSLT